MDSAADSVSTTSKTLIFPGETPTKVELQQFLDLFMDEAEAKGYGPLLRGEMPLAALQYTQRNLDEVPELTDSSTPGAATRLALRADIAFQNSQKAKQLDALLREYRNRIASLLARSMRSRAGLRLRKLRSSFAVAAYPGTYDGVKMVSSLQTELDTVIDTDDSDKHEEIIEQMRDNHLADNCSGQEFADKVNSLIREDHNPYLEKPYDGERFGRLIIKFLPLALSAEGRALQRELFDKGTLKDETRVFEACLRIVKMAHRPGVVSAAVTGTNKAGWRNKHKKGNDPPQAQAAVARDHKRNGNRPPYALPDGQLCSKGTCNFNHDQTNPG
eukprot:6214156-Pleurochrysis_carterae.AAC.1